MNKCGDCKNWMKTSECPFEKVGKKMSMNEPVCKDFDRKIFDNFYSERQEPITLNKFLMQFEVKS